jgi:hypothetical protein
MPTLSDLLGTIYAGVQGVQGIQGAQGVQGTAPTNVGLTANIKNAPYTLAIGDVGEFIGISTGGITVPQNVFSTGDVITIYNSAGFAQTVTAGAGASLYVAGSASTSVASIGSSSVSTILCISSNNFIIVGSAGDSTSVTSALAMTGGTETTVSGITYHIFTTSNTFTVTTERTANLLMVGGGGGVITSSNLTLPTGPYSITIGSGGNGGGPGSPGTNGGDTILSNPGGKEKSKSTSRKSIKI